MSDNDPGVPLSHYLTHGERCHGVLFSCSCGAHRVVPLAVVIEDLERRGVGGPETGVREVWRFSRKPCAKCGARIVSTSPAWAPPG